MALIVDDGTGLATAEAYISVTDADAYFLARANTAWAALTTGAKEAALRQGADYLEGYRWKGERLTSAQALAWPRSGVVVDGVTAAAVPEAIRRANAELAVRASQGALSVDVGAAVKSEQVGPISVTYQDGARQQTRFEAVERMIAAYLFGGGWQIPVVRA